MRPSFDYATGLEATSRPLREFTVTGADNVIHPAEARVEGNTVVVWND
ncbi:hypothetical protein [Hymenobacter fodinae]|nr:hypothetical protein [Hymenobacter fodinae]